MDFLGLGLGLGGGGIALFILKKIPNEKYVLLWKAHLKS